MRKVFRWWTYAPWKVTTIDNGSIISKSSHEYRVQAEGVAVQRCVDLNLHDASDESRERTRLNAFFKMNDAYKVDGYEVVISREDEE